MKDKLEKLITLSLKQGKEWEEIEKIIHNKSLSMGMSKEETDSLLKKNKPLPPPSEDEVSLNQQNEIEQNIQKFSDIFKSFINLQLKFIGWLYTFGKVVKTEDLTKEWNNFKRIIKK